jgi:hypothetical protein
MPKPSQAGLRFPRINKTSELPENMSSQNYAGHAEVSERQSKVARMLSELVSEVNHDFVHAHSYRHN